MGGVGKTTLVQSVYNDANIKEKFDLQAWVCVSDDFDALKVTTTMAEAVTKSACKINDMNLIHLDLKERLAGKKFLIVLDDVWIEDPDIWSSLITPLQCGARGSKILVTTRNDTVANVVQTIRGYHLKQLSNEDCWLVFANCACLSSQSSAYTDLQNIGKQIVRKCKGLPLAAQSLGGLLRGKRDIRDWNNILNSNFWEISEKQSKIIPALRISYQYLPPWLKRCFVYCSLYPKDYEFEKEELVVLWMAEDLLQPSKNGMTPEEVGYEHFNDLASRSFFQKSGNQYRSERFVMHDLVHDLATLLGREFFFRTDELGNETKIGLKTRHLSFSGFGDPVCENFEIFSRANFLRTFLQTNFRRISFNNERAAHIILSNLKYLRVLSFCHFPDLDALPDLIGELIHLRYLDLSYTAIKTLPESLCNLYNLRTLKLRQCWLLTRLPNDMQNLVNLCHLDIYGTSLEEMPREMSKLIHLQHLSHFVVGKHEEMGIKELGTLSNLHGSFSIKKLENVSNNYEASEARIVDKKHLKELQLRWSPDARDNFADTQSEMNILDKLQPAQNLEILRIYGYRGTKFPEWVGDPSYHNITTLNLFRCKNCCTLLPLGQLRSLMKLTIRELNMVETIGSEFYKNGNSFSETTPFPSLEYLSFINMSCWETWHHPNDLEASFPVLKSLVIRDCPNLRGELPTHLPALKRIEIVGCDHLASSLQGAPAIQDLMLHDSNKVALWELPLSLEKLHITGRQMTESVFGSTAITLPTSLQSLWINDCTSTISFSTNYLPKSLKSLSITNCRNLDFLKQSYLHESLELLDITSSCDCLTTLPLETFPYLVNLYINSCENLECFSGSKSLQNLSYISIVKCPKFVSFPRKGLFAPNLTSFKVSKCSNLKSLPSYINTTLTKLEDLVIYDCPEIETFPEGGMPPSLRSLYIQNCEKLLRSPSLTSMDMLTRLSIRCPPDSLESFPNEGFALLPPSLTSLELYEFSSLHTLDCTRLLSLTSLQELTISNCPKRENMAGEKLPTSLIKLVIYGCPLLGERCRMKHLEIWPKISHIRGIDVNGRWL